MKVKLTARRIETMKPNQALWDASLPGFGVRTRAKAEPRYVVKTVLDGRQKLITIGRHGILTLEQARQAARRILGEVASGNDPVAKRRKKREEAQLTLKIAAQKWIEEYVIPKRKPRTAKDYQDILERCVLPRLGSTPLTKLTRRQIAQAHHKMNNAPRAANIMLSVLSSLWEWCLRCGLVEGENPTRHIERYPENKRERFLSPAELAKLGEVLREYEPRNPYAVAALRLLILTGARRGEILSLCWEHVDIEKSFLRLPDSKTGAKKIALPAPAALILSELPRLEGNPYVIVGSREGRPLVNLKDPWAEIRAKAGLEDVRIHDLRHSYASMAASRGMGLHLIGKLLGHSQAQTTHRYAHLADDPLKSAAETVAGDIAQLLMAKKIPSNKGKLIQLSKASNK